MTGTFVTVVVVTLVVLSLFVVAMTASVDLGLRLSATVHRWARRRVLCRRERRAMRRELRALRRAELTSDDIDVWCEVLDDGEA